MQTDRTPGPWHAMIDGFVYAQGGERIADAAPWASIAKNRKEVERTANASLIAAAPDLLVALEEMTALAKGPPGGVSQQVKRDVIAKAESAIARAMGMLP